VPIRAIGLPRAPLTGTTGIPTVRASHLAPSPRSHDDWGPTIRTAASRRRAGLVALLATGLAVLPAVGAWAVEVPPAGSSVLLRTNGPLAPATAGDKYTTGNPAGHHILTVEIPCAWPASRPVYLDLYSPEVNVDGAAGGTGDVVTGAPDSAVLRLFGPTGLEIPTLRDVWSPSVAGDAETWYPWGTIDPAACGTYTVQARVVGDDQNAWRLRAGWDDDADVNNPPPATADDADGTPGTGDELVVGLDRASVVPVGGGTPCFTLYEHVPVGTDIVDFRNFDVGPGGRITYYAPSDVYDATGLVGGTPGTVSAPGLGAKDKIDFPEPGWWRIVTCAPSGDQLVQEGSDAIGYLEQPPTPVLGVSVSDGRTGVERGEALTWTATITNTSGGATAGAARVTGLTGTVDPDLTGVSCAWVAPATGTCSVTGGTLTATLTTPTRLVAGATAAVRITGTVGPTASGSLPVSVTAAYSDVFGRSFVPAGGSDTDTHVARADLSVTVSDSPDPVYFGNALTYTVGVSNAGPAAATGVRMTTTLPAGLVPATAAGTGWTCGVSGQTVTCTRPSLAIGPAPAVTITATVTATSGTVTTTATVSAAGTEDPAGSDNSATATTGVLTEADLSLTKSHVGNLAQGQLGFYSLTATNSGPSPTSGPVTITDTLPTGLTFVSATGSGWLCAAVGQVVTCDRPAGLGVESSGLTLVVDVADTAPAGVTNVATLTGPDPDPDSADRTASDPTAVETGRIAGTVWDDGDADGVRDAGEPFLPGLSVRLTGPVTRTATTSTAGEYSFVGLVAGTYSVTVTPPAKYVTTTPPHPRSVTIAAGEQLTGLALGFRYVNNPPVAVNDSGLTTEDTPVTVAVLANDSDADGDPLTLVGATNGASGTVVCGATSCEYRPAANAHGTDAFSYTIRDPDGDTSTATVTITITPVNDAPEYTAAANNTSQTIPVLGTLSALAASDVDGDPLTFTLVGGALPPGVTLNSNGSFTGQAGAPGPYSATIEVTDGNGGTDSTTLAIQVGGPTANTPPAAANDTAVTDEDVAVPVAVLANDSDLDLDTLAVTGWTAGAFGSVTCTATECRYEPAPNRFGVDTFTYTVSDGTASSTATVTVTVNEVNDAPRFTSAATNTSQTIPVFGSLSALAANDADLDPLTYTLVGGSLPPGITLEPTGAFSNAATGPGTFTADIRVSDGRGGTHLTTLTVQVGGPTANTPPEATPDGITTDEDTPGSVDVVANDADVDLDTLTVTGFTQGTFGSVSCSGRTCTYTPSLNFVGSDTFTYTVSDGLATDTATVSVTVNPVNDPPRFTTAARNTSQTVAVGSPLQSLQATDVEGDALTFTLVSGSLPTGITLQPNGTFGGTADTPGSYSAVIQVADGNGGTDTTTLTVQVGGPTANTPPQAGDDVVTVVEDGAETRIDVLANDTDVDLDLLSVTGVTAASGGTIRCEPTACYYTPGSNFFGTDTLTYTVSDGLAEDSGLITITVTAVNDPPVASPDARSTPEDTARTMPNLIGNDTDVDGGPLTITAWTQGANGSVDCATGACVYTPAPNFTGTDTFTYTVSDGRGGTSTTIVTMTVTPVNDAPVAVDDTATTDEDTSVVLLLLSNDTDVEGDPLTISAATNGTFGTVTCGPTQCTYLPDPNRHGTDTFLYTLADPSGATDEGSVTITVRPVNDLPIAQADSIATGEDQPVTIQVTANDTDVDGDTLAASVLTQPGQGSATCSGGTCDYLPNADANGPDSFTYQVSDGNGGTASATVTILVGSTDDPPVARDDVATTAEDSLVTVFVLTNDTDVDSPVLTVVSANPTAANGTVTCGTSTCSYLPAADFHGTDSFVYTISDGPSSASATVQVTVTPVNDLPVVVDETVTTGEDRPTAPIPVLANDSDVDGDPLTVASWSDGANGSVSCGVGTCVYTPRADFNGTDSFTYLVSDGAGGLVEGLVSVTVTGDNDAPVARPDAVVTPEDTPATVLVLVNDSDVDGDPLTIVATTEPGRGTVTCEGGVCTYTPDLDATGADSFTYTVSDGAGGTATATVDVTITPVNDAPVAAPDAVSATEDRPVTFPLLANDTDVDGDPLTVVATTQPAHGTLTCSAGTCTYVPAANFAGVDTFEYTISDGAGGTATGRVTITVAEVNDLPVPGADAIVVVSGGRVEVPVLGNDTDADGDPLRVASVTQPGHGSVTCSATTCTYVADPGYAGPDSFSYTVSDGRGGTRVQVVRVTVLAAPVDPPSGGGGGVIGRPGTGTGGGLPGTGAYAAELALIGLLLVLAGSAALVLAPRRKRAA
jgi:large repetitive protein